MPVEHRPAASQPVVDEDPTVLVVTLGSLRAEITKAPWGLALYSADRPLLCTPLHPSDDVFDDDARHAGLTYTVDGAVHGGYVATGRRRRWYRLTEVMSWSIQQSTITFEVATDDPLERLATVTLTLDAAAGSVGMDVELGIQDAVIEFNLAGRLGAEEDIFGLGERFERGNHRGTEVVHWVEDACIQPGRGHDWTYWPVPFFVSSDGYGVFVNTSARATFRFGTQRPDAWSVSVDESALSAVFFAGPTPADVVTQFTARTGRPPLPPPWALGVWKTVIGGENAIAEQAQRLKDNEMGVSALWLYDQLELDTNSGWGSGLGYPTGTYADIPAMIEKLHDDGWKVLGYLNPHFIPGRPTFDDGDARKYFAQNESGGTYLMPGVAADPDTNDIRQTPMAMMDFTSDEATAWWQRMLHRMLTVYGYDGWMEDFGEYLPADVRLADGRTGWVARNEYPTFYHRASAEVRARVDKQTVVFARSGHTGANKYVTAAWPGDQHTDWTADKGLAGIVPAGLSLGLAGVSIWGPDIAGYFDDSDGSGSAADEELWIRWCEFGALTPLMRDHLAQKIQTPNPVTAWTSDATVSVWQRMAALHNRLFPYLYTYAHTAHRTGLPIMRHLVLGYPDDLQGRRQDSTYLLGAELLVAPVVESGVRSREVYLPAGQWYRFGDGTCYEGARSYVVPAPLGDPPVFARAGSVVPLLAEAPAGLTASRSTLDTLPLQAHIQPQNGAADTTYGFVLYDGTEITVIQQDTALDVAIDGPTDRPISLRFPDGFDVAREDNGVRQAAGSEVRVDSPGRRIRMYVSRSAAC